MLSVALVVFSFVFVLPQGNVPQADASAAELFHRPETQGVQVFQVCLCGAGLMQYALLIFQTLSLCVALSLDGPFVC